MKKIVKTMQGVFSLIAIVFAAGVVLNASIDVFNRLAIGSSLAWAQQMAVWLNIFVIFIFAPVMVVEDTHLRVVFLRDKIKGLARRIVDNLNRIGTIIFCGLMAWTGQVYVSYLLKRGISRQLGIWFFPYWIVAIILPVGMFLLLVLAVYLLFTGQKKQEE